MLLNASLSFSNIIIVFEHELACLRYFLRRQIKGRSLSIYFPFFAHNSQELDNDESVSHPIIFTHLKPIYGCRVENSFPHFEKEPKDAAQLKRAKRARMI